MAETNISSSESKEEKTVESKVNNKVVVKVPNKNLHFFYRVLNVPLHGQELKDRNSIGRVLYERVNEMEEKRVGLFKELADLDEKGNPITQINPNTKESEYKVSPENYKIANSKWEEILKETWDVEIDKSIARRIRELS